MSATELGKRLQGTLANESTDPATDVQDTILDFKVNMHKPTADAMASDTSTIGAFKAPFDLSIVEVAICPIGTLTGHDTNNAVITLGKADGAGGSSTAIGAITTTVASGNWAADTFKTLTLTAANVNVNDGQIVTLKITKGASGVAVPISSYTIRCRKR